MITLKTTTKTLNCIVPLPSSKSESNRALIIQALASQQIDLHNLSSARDTQTMIRLLESEGHVLDVIDAGTTMRFLTAYCCAAGRDQILTGTPRMCQRPIGILVDALRNLGAEIDYWKQEGFPPLHIVSKGTSMKGGELEIPGNVSSQFITALLMIGPVLEGGLRLTLTGKIYSKPYIQMTLGLMKRFGVACTWEDESTLLIPEKNYKSGEYTIESDWSAASYWYSMLALAEDGEVFLKGLRKKSFQGDSKIAKIMERFGIHSKFEEEGVRLTKNKDFVKKRYVKLDFTDVPDLAQTIAVVSAATGIPVHMTGLESLRIKETDRILALQNELAHFNVKMEEKKPGVFTVHGKFEPSQKNIKTYEDHRMAMAFAPLVWHQSNLNMGDHTVVQKSYPEYWRHLEKAGVKVNEW